LGHYWKLDEGREERGGKREEGGGRRRGRRLEESERGERGREGRRQKEGERGKDEYLKKHSEGTRNNLIFYFRASFRVPIFDKFFKNVRS
jgi:hypothetical protein